MGILHGGLSDCEEFVGVNRISRRRITLNI